MRWEGYDYASAGTYVVTIVTAGRVSLFGDVVGSAMALNELGTIVDEEWRRSAAIRREVSLDTFIVMPNHLHGIVMIDDLAAETDHVGAHGGAPCISETGVDLPAWTRGDRAHGRVPLRRPPRSLGSLVAGFKAAATKRINIVRGWPGAPVWQRGYHDRVVRDDAELDRFRWYINQNPTDWARDRENPGG